MSAGKVPGNESELGQRGPVGEPQGKDSWPADSSLSHMSPAVFEVSVGRCRSLLLPYK